MSFFFFLFPPHVWLHLLYWGSFRYCDKTTPNAVAFPPSLSFGAFFPIVSVRKQGVKTVYLSVYLQQGGCGVHTVWRHANALSVLIAMVVHIRTEINYFSMSVCVALFWIIYQKLKHSFNRWTSSSPPKLLRKKMERSGTSYCHVSKPSNRLWPSLNAPTLYLFLDLHFSS